MHDHGDNQPATAKTWIKVLTVCVCAVFVCTEVWAAAALAYDEVTGVLGYGIGTDKPTAKAAALADCTNNGATKPLFWFWYSKPGWGATCYSDDGGGAWSIGGALGYRTKRRAKRVAKRECKDGGGQNCQIVDVFRDTTPVKSQGRGVGMRLHS